MNADWQCYQIRNVSGKWLTFKLLKKLIIFKNVYFCRIVLILMFSQCSSTIFWLFVGHKLLYVFFSCNSTVLFSFYNFILQFIIVVKILFTKKQSTSSVKKIWQIQVWYRTNLMWHCLSFLEEISKHLQDVSFRCSSMTFLVYNTNTL